MVDFPNSPVEGDIWTEEGQTWKYLDGAWAVSANSLDLNPVTIVEADTTAGWQVWGDILIQWGRTIPDANGNGFVTFAQPFKTPPSCQVVVAGITPGSYQADQQYVNALQTPTETGLVFEQRFQDVSGNNGIVSNVTSDWLAIGEAPDDLKQPKTVEAIGGDAALFVRKEGDTMTGDLTVTPPDAVSAKLIAKNSAGNSASLESTGNSHLWFRDTDGVAAGLLYHDVGNDEMKLRKYNNGSSTGGMTFYNDGDIQISGAMRTDVDWGGKAITNIKYVIFNGSSTTGDYIRWDTADGFRMYENGALIGRVGVGGSKDTRFTAVYSITTSSGANVNVSSSGNGILKRVSSSGKYKQNIETLQRTTAMDSVMALRPVVYQSKIETDPDTPYQGFITEEVAAAMPIALADDGENYDSRALMAALVATVQELKSEIDTLKAAMPAAHGNPHGRN